jgi:hypothetical protein
VYLFRKFPLENARFKAFLQQQKSINPPEPKAVKDKRAKNAEKEKRKAVIRARKAENAKKKAERNKRKAAKKSKVFSRPR